MRVVQFPLRELPEPHVERWSPRRSCLFIVVVSLLCWAAVGCTGCVFAG